MRLTVFGDGGTEVTRQARDAGHQVTAVESVDVTDPGALAGTLEDADAAVSMLRHRLGGSATILTEGMHAILAAMEEAEARRLVAVSSGGLFGQADAHRMEELITESPSDWTIMRPRRLLNTPLESPHRDGLANAILRALDDPSTIARRICVEDRCTLSAPELHET